jgi:hypothetical protein
MGGGSAVSSVRTLCAMMKDDGSALDGRTTLVRSAD